MEIKWIDNISAIRGVNSAILVDFDGIVVAEAGKMSDWIPPLSALMVKKLIDEVGADTFGEWLWTQCDTENVIISLVNVGIGILIVFMKPDANIGLVQIEARNVKQAIKETFSFK